MLYVYGGIEVDPARIDEVSAAAARFQARCADEVGCVTYSLSWDIARPNFLRLLEVWEPTESHPVHTAQPHVAEWTAFISSAAVAPPEFTKFVVDVVAD